MLLNLISFWYLILYPDIVFLPALFFCFYLLIHFPFFHLHLFLAILHNIFDVNAPQSYGGLVGYFVGRGTGDRVGRFVGYCVGLRVALVGRLVGDLVGLRVGLRVGESVGRVVGDLVGLRVGLRVGD